MVEATDRQPFLVCLASTTMRSMIALTSSATRRHKLIVILSGPAYGAKCSTPVSVRLSRALSLMADRTKCCCTPRKLVRSIFGARVSAAVAVIAAAAIWWHIASVDDTIAAQQAVGVDALCAMPWLIAGAIRATFMPMPEEGGEA